MVKTLYLGNSHLLAVRKAVTGKDDVEVHWLKTKPGAKFGEIELEDAVLLVQALKPQDALVLSHLGTLHNVLGLVNHDTPFALIGSGEFGSDYDGTNPQIIPERALWAHIEQRFSTRDGLVARLAKLAPCPVYHLMPPPPKEHLEAPGNPEKLYHGRSISEFGFAPAPRRLALWQLEERFLRSHLSSLGVVHVPPPAETVMPGGYLQADYHASDTTHANALYGMQVLDQVRGLVTGGASVAE